jgi:hypothetical protein
MRARELHDKARRRAELLLASVERISRGLASSRGRKSIVILSEGFLQDADRDAFERAVDASRRGNTSVSFVDVRGLVGLPGLSAEQSDAPPAGDLALAGAMMRADAAGAETLADRTGGSVAHDTNDLAGAVRRFADESSAYYLLGYQTDRPFDGRWRKLQVEVSRPGLRVRARRGYYALAEPLPLAVPRPPKDKKRAKDGKSKDALPVRALDPALAVGGQRDEIPIRMAPHVFETDAAGEVRVLVALEVDTSALGFSGADSGSERKAKLDVTLLGVSRDHPVAVPLDSAVELSLEQETPGGWWIFSRELKLPPGPAQVRAFVRDTATGETGLVAQRFEVPGPGIPYLSTPILTNRISKSASPGAKLVPVAHRRFAARGSLFCAYEVYVEPGRELTSIPDVRSSLTLFDDSGQVVSRPPTAVPGSWCRWTRTPCRGIGAGPLHAGVTGQRHEPPRPALAATSSGSPARARGPVRLRFRSGISAPERGVTHGRSRVAALHEPSSHAIARCSVSAGSWITSSGTMTSPYRIRFLSAIVEVVR